MVKLETRTIIAAPIERCFDLARSVEVHLAANVHYGEQAVAVGGVTTGIVGLGERVTWRARHFFVQQELTSEITALERPVHFQVTMIAGAFRMMRNDHYFRPVNADTTEVENVFVFAAPLWPLGLVAEWVVLRRYMRNLLLERNAVLKEFAER
jgi:hypothetical protein